MKNSSIEPSWDTLFDLYFALHSPDFGNRFSFPATVNPIDKQEIPI